MTTRRRVLSLGLLLGLAAPAAPAAWRAPSGAAAVKQRLERLRVVGSVLMIAAHPDDENTAFLAWCAQRRHLRTGYLSLTRGEGGQNLIGNEQGELLGVIRTQELLAARRVDGAEQFFTRAIDFGFSKTAAETLAKWGREEVLSDVVWVIRAFRPDVVVLRFSGTPRDGHGHHQASAILGREAFRLAGDANAFPDQLKRVRPWQPRRLFWNTFSFTRQQEAEAEKMPQRLVIDTGEYNALLGMSYGEIAGLSRSQHRSQGMGSPERRGAAPNYLVLYDGEPAQQDMFDGIDTSWNRLPGGAAVAAKLDAALAAFSADSPERVIPHLMEARRLMQQIDHPDARRKLGELDETVALAAGLWLDVSAARPAVAPGSSVTLNLSAVNRSALPVRLEQVEVRGLAGAPSFGPAELAFNRLHTQSAQLQIPADAPLSQPLQLRHPPKGNLYGIPDLAGIGPAEADPVLTAVFRVAIGGGVIEVKRPVEHRYIDRVRGELTRPFVIVPAVSIRLPETPLLFRSREPRPVPVEVRATAGPAAGALKLDAPEGWRVEPPSQNFEIADAGQATTLVFRVSAPEAPARGWLRATAQTGGRAWSHLVTNIEYEHIPPQTVLRAAETRLLRDNILVSARRVGYVMGAGDTVPEALRELGCDVVLLDEAQLAHGDLSAFDAILTGVRAWNVRADLRAAHARLRSYMERGGTLIVQYNTLEGFGPEASDSILRNVGPFPLRIGRNRVTVEEAPVRFLLPDHPLLRQPNRITPADFEGWVQERALYFPAEWDPRYEALLETADPDEPPQRGGLLFARVGKGAYIYTSFAWWRQLPAGVPGAWRIFANLVSAGR
ncbi:MAG: PIG-L family deacetylase [Bryobacteraceae bacterium]|nr:PIG-L family deacetylase [Bryobacteraceae bacterium]